MATGMIVSCGTLIFRNGVYRPLDVCGVDGVALVL